MALGLVVVFGLATLLDPWVSMIADSLESSSSSVPRGGARAQVLFQQHLAGEDVDVTQLTWWNLFRQGRIDGAEHARKAREARRQDELAVHSVGVWSSTVASAVRGTPGRLTGGAAERVFGELGEKAAGAGLGPGGEWAMRAWTGHLEEAQRQADAETRDRYRALDEALDEAARESGFYEQAIDEWQDLTSEEREARMDSYRSRKLSDYGNAYYGRYHAALRGPAG
jgi:hypothetical protein